MSHELLRRAGRTTSPVSLRGGAHYESQWSPRRERVEASLWAAGRRSRAGKVAGGLLRG